MKANDAFAFTVRSMALSAKAVETGLRRPYVIRSTKTGNKDAFILPTSDIYHIRGIKGFKMATTPCFGGLCIVKIEAGKHLCPRCHSGKASPYPVSEHEMQAQK
ncbi:hypothetical protein [Oligosphaera ethanolica]|uniref:Uncharacterized protein n=1 Tax=Oligosphaera ethanolica TaxID=760260 RepID=A0AAE4APZ3_9BACT|nr:hypothetical protein [Oligosphaera ethanolica]MDQ0290533.1 hypothetical protein [Oligosphaera ethanolica]